MDLVGECCPWLACLGVGKCRGEGDLRADFQIVRGNSPGFLVRQLETCFPLQWMFRETLENPVHSLHNGPVMAG
jgi:hypothetical protein